MMTIALLFAQIILASLVASYSGNFKWHKSTMNGFGILGQAELAFAEVDIGYVQNDIISTEAFYTLMATAFVLNTAVPISIKLWKPYFVGEKTLTLKVGNKTIQLSKTDHA